MKKQSDIMLSISILVSNRKDTIRKCMEGLRPLLENIPSELIVVDTVGEENSDGSLAIAKEYATKVVRFEWCNDFAAARNTGLLEACGEWFMFIDDDEWFEDAGEVVEFFKSGEYKEYKSAYFSIRNYSDNEGSYSTGVVHRMVEREEATKFVSPVHEYLTPMKHPRKAFSCQLHHQGYVFSTEERKKEHSYRNISLLEPEFEKKQWDMHLRTQLIQEYMCLEEMEEKGRLLCEETFQKIDKKLYKTKEFQWIMLSYARQANRKKDYEMLLERTAMLRSKYPMGVVADYAICILEVTAYYNLKQYGKAIEKVKEAQYKKNYIQENQDVFEEQRILDIETFMDDGMYSELLRFGILCRNKAGDEEGALEWCKERFRYMTIPVLTVSLLVSNRKNTIQKCLDSIKPLLEAVPSELIVVDTVGEENSDGSLAVAKEYADKVINVTWCDDFAAARNAGLKEAKGEWFLYLDDDEWFENVDDIISFFISGEYLDYNSATYKVRNYKDDKGSMYADVAVSRMIHRAKNSEFVGCINETFNNIYTPCKALNSYVHHYGYVYVTQEAKQARMKYTLKLLQDDLVKYPGNLRNRLQLAIVLSVQNPPQAVLLCEETLALCKDKKESEMYRKVDQLLNGLYAKGVKAQEEPDKKIILSISMLVSNRIKTIGKCMESLQPILESLPSELIVVDTVGEEHSDGSLAIAKKYATKVVHFDWCNDFAAARNAGLFEANGQWFMFLDDDEWFDDVTELIEFFTSGEYKKYASATYRIRDYVDKQGNYSMGVLHRLVKLEKETKFVEPVHEYLSPVKLPCKPLQCFVHHSGYVFESMEEHREHSRRNLSLLRPAFEKNPADVRLRAQMIQECMFLPELEAEALTLCEEALRLDKSYYGHPNFQWILMSYVRLAVRRDNWQQGVERIDYIKENFPLTEFARLAINTMELKAREKLGLHENAEKLLQELKTSREFLLADAERRTLQESFDIGVFMEESILADAMARGIVSLHKLGKRTEASVWTKERQSILEKPLLSISLLVSNNLSTIEKCMKSLQPLLTAIPSELIVVDTVGAEHSDGSLNVAKNYATKMVHFDWCDDFAAARNAGLDEAQGEWFMFLDDDEWFEDISEITEFFQTGEYLLYSSATYQIRNYTKKDGSAYSEATLGRMTKKTANTRFEGAIHETFSQLYLPCKNFDCFVHHYGYAYENEQEKQAHRDRNLALLKKEIEKNPLELRYRAQMAMELASFDNRAAMEFCEETFRLCAEQKERNDFQWQLSLVFRLHEALNSSLNETEKSYRELKERFGFNETAENGICYQMTRICILKDEPEKGHPYVKKYFETLACLQQNQQTQQLQMTADFSRYQTNGAYFEMLHFGAYCAFKAKAYKDAWDWYEAMPWEAEGYSNQESFAFAMQLYRENPNQKVLLGMVKRLMKNSSEVQKEAVKKALSEALDMIKHTNSEAGTGTNWIKSDIKLTIGILVSNNIKTIRNCMESLKSILEEVSSELIVVDTVGDENSDGSIAIAREYATKVVRFEWCNDFAAARNVCIDHARGEWFLYVDDDEWFDDAREIIEFFKNGECDKYGQGLYHIRNYAKDGTFTQTVIGRLHHRTKQMRFVGQVHEVLQPTYLPCKLFENTFAHHTGYVYMDEAAKKKHQDRNLSLLWKEIETKGYTPHICAQTAQELLHVQDTWDEGFAFCQKVIPILVEEQGTIRDSSTQWILVATARYYSMIGDYNRLLQQAEYLKENYALTEMSKMFLSVIVIGWAWKEKEYAVVEQKMEEFLDARIWLDEHPEQALQQSQLDFGNFYNDKTMAQILHIGAMCANEQGKYELANSYWKRFPWDSKEINKADYRDDMNRTVNGLKELAARRQQTEKLKEFLMMLQAMEEAEKCAMSLAAKEQYAEMPELLSGMQELAIAVGTGLDQTVGEGSEEVSLLEAYCELVWKCSNAETKEEMMTLLEEADNASAAIIEKIRERL